MKHCSWKLFGLVLIFSEMNFAQASDGSNGLQQAQEKIDDSLGYALRFPRFVKYRMDKSATDTTSSTELAHLYEIQYQQTAHEEK